MSQLLNEHAELARAYTYDCWYTQTCSSNHYDLLTCYSLAVSQVLAPLFDDISLATSLKPYDERTPLMPVPLVCSKSGAFSV